LKNTACFSKNTEWIAEHHLRFASGEGEALLEKTFGYMKPNTVYTERIGAYGVGFDQDGRIPVVMTHLHSGQEGYFLLGGGLDNGEGHADCIIRECLEEAGLSVTPKHFVCKGDYYHFAEHMATNFHGIGYFYYMDINEVVKEPSEPDHYLVWLTMDEIRDKLFLPHQVWAVEQVHESMRQYMS